MIIVYSKPGCPKCSTLKKKLDMKGVTYTVIDDIDYMMLSVDGYSRIRKIQNDILDKYFEGDKAQYREFFEDIVLWHNPDTDKDEMIEALYNEYKRLRK